MNKLPEPTFHIWFHQHLYLARSFASISADAATTVSFGILNCFSFAFSEYFRFSILFALIYLNWICSHFFRRKSVTFYLEVCVIVLVWRKITRSQFAITLSNWHHCNNVYKCKSHIFLAAKQQQQLQKPIPIPNVTWLQLKRPTHFSSGQNVHSPNRMHGMTNINIYDTSQFNDSYILSGSCRRGL